MWQPDRDSRAHKQEREWAWVRWRSRLLGRHEPSDRFSLIANAASSTTSDDQRTRGARSAAANLSDRLQAKQLIHRGVPNGDGRIFPKVVVLARGFDVALPS
jgi:hypothetical protein